MMQWFGPSWGAPVCNELRHTATPVGKHCTRCGKAFKARDQGFTVPYITDTEPLSSALAHYHARCFMKEVMGDDYEMRSA